MKTKRIIPILAIFFLLSFNNTGYNGGAATTAVIQTYKVDTVYKKEIIKTLNYDIVTGTYYNAVVSQTDNTPFHTADRSFIDTSKVDSLRWCALSQDLLNFPQLAKKDSTGQLWRGKFKYGDTIIISIKNYEVGREYEKIIGRWVVHDCMNKRYRKRIDFLASVDKFENNGLWSNLIILKEK